MAKFEDLEDVTIRNPKAGDVVKYTATGWVNGADATGTPPGGNPCGTNNFSPDKSATITEPWTWEVGDAKCGVIVEHSDGVNNLDEFSRLCPGRVEVGNKNGRGELKTFDGGNTRLSAFDSQLSFYDMNNPSGVTLSELVACCDTDAGGGGTSSSGGAGTNAVQMVNFPNAGTFSYEAGRQTKTAIDPSETPDPDWNDVELWDVFEKDTNAQTIDMPPGTNAAVLFFSYGLTLTPTSLVTNEVQDGHANAAYNMEVTANKAGLTMGPGSLAASIRARTEIIPWEQASLIGDGSLDEIRKRAPGQSTSGYKAVRINFPVSTVESPTRITLSPDCRILRVRRARVTVGSGRVVCIPFVDDNNFRPDLFALEDQDYDEVMQDDGGLDKGFEQSVESQEIKREMNYYATSISETLTYDQGLVEEDKATLEGALQQIFDLKREQVDNLEYYYDRLQTIRNLVVPIIGFKFGFETDENTVRTF